MGAAAVRVDAGSNASTGERLVRYFNTITKKNVPLEIWHDKQRNIVCLDQHQMTRV